MEQHSVIEQSMVRAFMKCNNRKQVRQFIKDLTRKERKFLQGQLEYKQLMRMIREQMDEEQ